MRSGAIVFLLVAVSFFVLGCGEDSAGPQVLSISEKIAGEWECIEFYVHGDTRGVPDNNVFWYFTKTGEFCSQYITAYGGYYTGSTGDLDNRLSTLQETNLHGEAIEWRLALNARSDTLHAVSVAPDSLSGYEWVLIQTGDGPESSCF